MASQVVFVAPYADMANLARQYFLSAGDRAMLRTTLALRENDRISGAMEISQDVTRLRELEQRVRRETVRLGCTARHTIDHAGV